VELFNDNIFCELRAYAQISDDFVNKGWNLASLVKGGGKGGTLMAFVGSQYIVKELSLGDHRTLLDITGSYSRHIRANPTLLCPVYLHFRDKVSARFFFVMRNTIGEGPFLGLYDLKGCADDKTIEKDGRPVKAVHKRIWNVGMWCGTSRWSDERRTYYDGKKAAKRLDIEVTSEQRQFVVDCIRRDTAWLASLRLMDYSLLVATKLVAEGGTASGTSSPSALYAPLTRKQPDGSTIVLTVSIIDYLQRWTNGKRVARALKFLEQDKATIPPAMYAERFSNHFAERLKPTIATILDSGGSQQQAIGNSKPKATATPVAPPAGDIEMEGGPEERLTSRAMTEDRVESRPVIVQDVVIENTRAEL
jgi:hypothetical protein